MIPALLLVAFALAPGANAARPPFAVGAGLVMVDLRTTVGWYQVLPAVEVWTDVGATWRMRLALAGALPANEAGEGWAYRQGWQRLSLTGGWTAGTRPLRFRVEAGPALSRVATRWTAPAEASVTQVLPGARGGVGLELPISSGWSIGGLAAATTRERGLDLDLRVGASRTW